MRTWSVNARNLRHVVSVTQESEDSAKTGRNNPV